VLSYNRYSEIDWLTCSNIMLVDVASIKREGKIGADFQENQTEFIVYDHHPAQPSNVQYNEGKVEQVGAAVTLLLEEIQAQQLPISEFEATLFGLGLYTDTGNFIYKNTTDRDLQMAAYLLKNGMNLEMVQRFSEQVLEPEQQQ